MPGFWEVTFTAPGNSVVWKSPVAPSRCDNTIVIAKKRIPGCVFGTIPSAAGFSQTAVPQFTKHVGGAQTSGLPRQFNSDTFLNRLTDPALRRKNGDRACPPKMKRPGKAFQCDEYPFRSTKQGAATAGAARSQPWCQMKDPARKGPEGWSRCSINSTQNASAGGSRGVFYSRERMLAGDPFQVGFLK